MNDYKEYPYKKADAFTAGDSLGNPAACIYTGKDTLTDSQMLHIAKQHKGFVSEMVFCSDSDVADCKLTYYSSECEVDFCGHGTIAAMYELVKSSSKLQNKKEILFETNKKGSLLLYNELQSEDAVYITAPNPEYLKVTATAEEIAQAMGKSIDIISNQYPIMLINAGLRTLLVPLSSYDVEVNLFPDLEKLKDLCEANGIDIILVFTMDTKNKANFAHSRVFAPRFGYLEDPATGSGNSAFGYYLFENKLWDGSLISIEQGGSDRIFNTVKLKLRGEKVLFGGRATLRIDGKYLVDCNS